MIPAGARRSPRGRAAIAGAVAVGALLALGACSGSSSPSADASRATTTAPARSTTTAPAAEGTAGCGRDPDVATIAATRPGDVEQTISSGGEDRIYRLAVPADYDPETPVPLVLNLHGSGSNALQASAYGDVPRAGTDRGMIVVAPQAIDGRWELGGTGRDGDFLMALVDDIEQRYCIDEDRVHIVGMSLGAWKAAATACANPGRFASAVLVTVEVFPGTCDPLPVLAFHGTADRTVPYGEGADPGVTVVGSNARLPGALHNIAEWADNGGCDPEPALREVGDDVVLRTYAGCDPGVDVELYTIQGGGHTWPGADLDIAEPSLTTHTIDATALALDWMEAHPRTSR